MLMLCTGDAQKYDNLGVLVLSMKRMVNHSSRGRWQGRGGWLSEVLKERAVMRAAKVV